MPLPDYGSNKRQIRVVDHRVSPTPFQTPGGNNSAPASGNTEAAPTSRKMTPGERARTVVGNNRLAVLCLVLGDEALPVGFVLPYALGEDGFPLIGVRSGTEEAAALVTGMKASLAVAETPLTASTAGTVGGVTLLGTIKPVGPGEEYDNAISSYTNNQPADAAALSRGAGRLFRLKPTSIVVASGSGDVAYISVDDYLTANSDPLAAVAPGLVTHLSNDQGGSLVLLCRAFGGQPGATSASLAGIDQYGMDLLATTPQGRESVRLSFTHPVTSPDEVRRELTTMARGARFKLGVG